MKSKALQLSALLFFIAGLLLTWWMLAQPLQENMTREGKKRPVLQIITSAGTYVPADSRRPDPGRVDADEEDAFSDVVLDYGSPEFGKRYPFMGASLTRLTIGGPSLRIGADDARKPIASRTFPNAANPNMFSTSGRLPAGIVVAPARSSPPGEPGPPRVCEEVPDEVSALLTPEQIERIEEIRQEFVKELAETGAKPGEPDYLQQWQRARTRGDLKLIALIGEEDFQQWQKHAQWQKQRDLPATPPDTAVPEYPQYYGR